MPPNSRPQRKLGHAMTGPIDILSNLVTPDSIERNFLANPAERDTFERLGLMDNLKGRSAAEFVGYLDEAGVGRVFVTAIQVGEHFAGGRRVQNTAEEVRDFCAEAGGRVHGLYGIDPLTRMEGVRRLETAVRDWGFVGAHIHPHGYDLPPDHAYWFPYYAKCAELGVPVVLSMGNTQDLLPIEAGRPIHLDRVALYFPELRIVCTHTGWPWIGEALALAGKHRNVFLGTSAYAPKYWTAEFVKFLGSWGQDKVLWGTDFPMIAHTRSLREIEALSLREGAKAKLLRENAVRVFGLT